MKEEYQFFNNMYRKQLICDACGKIVRGYDGKEEQNKDFISIRGQVIVNNWDKEENQQKFFYATPSKNRTVILCGFKCLEEWINMMKEKAIDSGWDFGVGSADYDDGCDKKYSEYENYEQ